MTALSPAELPSSIAGECRFHHLGIAVASINRSIHQWAKLGYRVVSPLVEDPIQGVRVLFLEGPGPRMELVEPLAGSEVLSPWIANGNRPYHAAFETADLSESVNKLSQLGGIVVREPQVAPALSGSLIAFLMLEAGWLVELIQSPADIFGYVSLRDAE